ncbi:MAG TPA: CPBP family intramembrane glutamic endopeptidase [Polyangia bacterium]
MMMMVVVGPLIEELMFRGRIQGAFERRFGPMRGVLITAVIFSVAHLADYKLPGTVITGVAFGAAVSLTGSVWAGVLLHTTNNALAALLAFTIDDPGLATPSMAIVGLLISLLALLAIGSLLWRLKNRGASMRRRPRWSKRKPTSPKPRRR